MTRRNSSRPRLFLWHRRVGLIAILLVILLCVTGILLNHTNDFNLDDSYIESPLILNWYGLEPTGNPITYPVNENNISQWDQIIFFNNKPVTSSEQVLRGAVQAERFIVAALDNEIVLISNTGEFIERMPTSESFSNIQRLGVKYKRSVIETSEPLYYMADEHILDWDVTLEEEITWSISGKLTESQKDELRHAYRGKGLTMERVILDLHSGRFFGRFGHYVMDLAAIALLFLSFSGLWVWWKRIVKQKNKRHYQKHHRLP